jgi:hypothetical protein
MPRSKLRPPAAAAREARHGTRSAAARWRRSQRPARPVGHSTPPASLLNFYHLKTIVDCCISLVCVLEYPDDAPSRHLFAQRGHMWNGRELLGPSASAFRGQLVAVVVQRGMKKPPQALSDANLRFPLVETRTASPPPSVSRWSGRSACRSARSRAPRASARSCRSNPMTACRSTIITLRWMTEAAGSKIRTIPASFPDLLKTPAVLRHEYRYVAGGARPRNWDCIETRVIYPQQPDTGIEARACVQMIGELAQKRGIRTGAASTAPGRSSASPRLVASPVPPPACSCSIEGVANWSRT